MTFLAIILSSLALLAATTSVLLILDERKRNQKRNTALLQYVDSNIPELADRIKSLEEGVVPDFEKAKEAANAVNNFNDGITGILGFDPYKALQAQRDAANGGEKD